MGVETEVYLKWDGVCFTERELEEYGTADDWRNFAAVGSQGADKPPQAENQKDAQVAHDASAKSGGTLSTQRAQVAIVSVSPFFAPCEEWALIKIKIKNIDRVGNLLLQIRDASNKLVYAERLVFRQVWALPRTEADALAGNPPLAIDSSEPKDKQAEKRRKRTAVAWAQVARSPYRVTVFVSEDRVVGEKDVFQARSIMHLGKPRLLDDPAKFPTEGEIARNPAPAPTGGALELDQTSVRLASFSPERVPWPEMYREVTGGAEYPEEPAAVKALPEDEKFVWAKCRLSQLGFWAGRIEAKDGQRDAEDFNRAVARYAAMRNLDPAATSAAPDPAKVSLDALVEHLCCERDLAGATVLLENEDKLFKPPDKNNPVRLFVDCSRFFLTAQESENGKYACESKWLSRPSLPLRAKLKVWSRDGKAERDVPEALRDFWILWTWEDPAEEYDRLLDSGAMGPTETSDFNIPSGSETAAVYSKSENRSRVRTYVQKTRDFIKSNLQAKGVVPKYEHNAPQEVGGLLTGDPAKDRVVVFAAHPKDAGSSKDDAKGFLTNHQIVWFRPSTIGGDRYLLTVKVEADAPPPATVAAWDKLVAGIKLEATTAPIELWRRLRVAGLLQWQDATGAKTRWDSGPFDLEKTWEAVRKEYAFSYLEALPKKLAELPDVGSRAIAAGSDFAKLVEKVLVDPSVTQARQGRAMYSPPVPATSASGAPATAAAADENKFSEKRVIPRVAVSKLVVDPDLSLNDPPPNGVIPSISRIFRFVFEKKLNELVKKAKAGWTGATGAKDHASFGDLWSLFHQWQDYDPDRDGVADPIKGLQLELRKAGAYLLGALEKLVACHGWNPNVSLSRTGTLAEADRRFFWIGGTSAPPTITYEEKPHAYSYSQELFPELMNLMLLPDADGDSVRAELRAWQKRKTLDAPRTASVCNLLAALFTEKPWIKSFTDELIWDGVDHFRKWLPSILEQTTDKAPIATGKFKKTDQRIITVYTKTPLENELLKLEEIIGAGLNSLVNDASFSPTLDRLVRKDLGCEKSGDQYARFADGLIVISGLTCEPFQIQFKDRGGKEKIEDCVIAGGSIGCPQGVVYVGSRTAMEPYALFAHEMGHVLFMDHFQNTQSKLFDHDLADPNCVMTYPLLKSLRLKHVDAMKSMKDEDNKALERLIDSARSGWEQVKAAFNKKDRGFVSEYDNFGDHTLPKLFRPHFCGKCNLKLRGWDISKDDFVPFTSGDSAHPLPDDPPYPAAQEPTPTPEKTAAKTKPALRFVHGGQEEENNPASEPELTSVPISFYPTLLAGEPQDATFNSWKLDALKPFSRVFGYDADTSMDKGAFKVEVHDPNLRAKSVYVTLEALMPTYSGKSVTGWAEFPDDERAKRSQVMVECRALAKDPHRFRSRYLRLVTDEVDYAALHGSQQSLLVTDMVDAGNDQVEILDQKIRVTYDPMLFGVPALPPEMGVGTGTPAVGGGSTTGTVPGTGPVILFPLHPGTGPHPEWHAAHSLRPDGTASDVEPLMLDSEADELRPTADGYRPKLISMGWPKEEHELTDEERKIYDTLTAIKKRGFLRDDTARNKAVEEESKKKAGAAQGGAGPGAAAAKKESPEELLLKTKPKPPAFSNEKVQCEVAVGDQALPKKRIRLHFHVFRPITIDGTDVAEPDVRKHIARRVRKWVRRVYSQAMLSPEIEAIDFLDLPPKNMLALQGMNPNTYKGARMAAGVRKGAPAPASPGAAPPPPRSVFEVTLATDPAGAANPTTVSIDLQSGMDLEAIGALLARRAGELGYDARNFRVPPSDGFVKTEDDKDEVQVMASCDVLFFRKNGSPVEVQGARHDDEQLDSWVAFIPDPATNIKIGPDGLDDEDNLIGGSPAQRRILRAAPLDDNRIDVCLVSRLKIAGRAYPGYASVRDEVARRFRPDTQIRRAAIMGYRYSEGFAMDGSDHTPFTLAHELGHVLGDCGHNMNGQKNGDLMSGVGAKANALDAPKRIYGDRLRVGFQDFNSLPDRAPSYLSDQKMQEKMRQRHVIQGIAKEILADW